MGTRGLVYMGAPVSVELSGSVARLARVAADDESHERKARDEHRPLRRLRHRRHLVVAARIGTPDARVVEAAAPEDAWLAAVERAVEGDVVAAGDGIARRGRAAAARLRERGSGGCGSCD